MIWTALSLSPLLLAWSAKIGSMWTGFAQLAAVGAAAFTAWTAFETRRIAIATKDTLAAQQGWNQRSKRPVLSVEPTYDFFVMSWGIEATNGPDFSGHNRHPAIQVPTVPAVRLTNWGAAPALNINATVSIEDGDEAIVIPPHYRRVPHGGAPYASIAVQREKYLAFRHVAGSTFLSAPRKENKEYFAACGSEATRDIEIGRAVLHLIFVRALQQTTRPDRQMFDRPYQGELTVRLDYDSTEEVGLTAEYRFRISTSVAPDAINGTARHIWEDFEGPLRVFLELSPVAPPQTT